MADDHEPGRVFAQLEALAYRLDTPGVLPILRAAEASSALNSTEAGLPSKVVSDLSQEAPHVIAKNRILFKEGERL
jgi:hypothetical protein